MDSPELIIPGDKAATLGGFPCLFFTRILLKGKDMDFPRLYYTISDIAGKYGASLDALVQMAANGVFRLAFWTEPRFVSVFNQERVGGAIRGDADAVSDADEKYRKEHPYGSELEFIPPMYALTSSKLLYASKETIRDLLARSPAKVKVQWGYLAQEANDENLFNGCCLRLETFTRNYSCRDDSFHFETSPPLPEISIDSLLVTASELKRIKELGIISRNSISYNNTMNILKKEWQATEEEIAAWIFIGPEEGGIAAYFSENIAGDSRRFSFSYSPCYKKYLELLDECVFLKEDIENFEPTKRYITGEALIRRWSVLKRPLNKISNMIKASRLMPIHPTFGLPREVFKENTGDDDCPTLEEGLFLLQDVEQIELKEGLIISPPVLGQTTDQAAPVVEQTTNDFIWGWPAMVAFTGLTRSKIQYRADQLGFEIKKEAAEDVNSRPGLMISQLNKITHYKRSNAVT